MSKKVTFPQSFYGFVFLSFLSSFAVGYGCAHQTWDKIKDSQDKNEIYKFIHENQSDINIEAARQRISNIEFEEAKKANTKYAYNSFIERHRNSLEAIQARRQLEEIDFAEATRTGTQEAYSLFLQQYPHGNLVDRAIKALAELVCAQGKAAKDIHTLNSIIAAHPTIPCFQSLMAHKENLLFSHAIASNSSKELMDCIQTFPQSQLAHQARRALLLKKVESLLLAAEFDRVITLINTQASKDEVPKLMEQVHQKQVRWIRASLDWKEIQSSLHQVPFREEKSLQQKAARLKQIDLQLEQFKQATGLIRKPLVSAKVGDHTLSDPRKRWLEARRLQYSPDEETATYLLDLLSDSYLEVQRQSLESLRQVHKSLGKIRSELWVEEQRARLLPTAKHGILLVRLAVLYDLAGDAEASRALLEKALSGQDEPDLWALALMTDIGLRSGQGRQSAMAASRFSQEAQAFVQRRTSQWEGVAGLGASDSAEWSLRQLYGLWQLWREVLSAFTDSGSPSRPKTDAFEKDFGPWVAAAREQQLVLAAWLQEKENFFSRKHPDYQLNAAPDATQIAIEKRQANEMQALALLALAQIPDAQDTLRWAACCHPRLSTRAWAAALQLSAPVVEAVWPLAIAF